MYTKFYIAKFSHECPIVQLTEGSPEEQVKAAVMDHSTVQPVSAPSWKHQQLAGPQCKTDQGGRWSACNWESRPTGGEERDRSGWPEEMPGHNKARASRGQRPAQQLSMGTSRLYKGKHKQMRLVSTGLKGS